MQDIPALLQVVRQRGDTFNPDDSQSQKQLYLAAKELADALQPPLDRVAHLSFHEPTIATAVRICVRLKVFDKLAEAKSPTNVEDLAKTTKADPKLLQRLLQHIATANYVTETGPHTFQANETTNFLADVRAQGMFTDCMDALSVVNANIIPYFETCLEGYKSPDDNYKTPFQFGQKTEARYFDWLFGPGNEERAQAFVNHMKLKTLGPRWFQEVPVAEILSPECGPDDVLLVDVGGAAGHDIEAFHETYPDMPGQLVLQDVPSTIDKVDASKLAPIKPTAHDFFTPQPIKGARGYYLKMVLHDWPDAQCRQILENLKPALVRGQSKILINELVVPEAGADWFTTSVDMIMMGVHAAHERRESEWKELVESVGLKLTKIWQCGEAAEKLIVVELA